MSHPIIKTKKVNICVSQESEREGALAKIETRKLDRWEGDKSILMSNKRRCEKEGRKGREWQMRKVPIFLHYSSCLSLQLFFIERHKGCKIM